MFCTRRREGPHRFAPDRPPAAVSIPPGPCRNENIEESTLARFLEFFDFRLLQQYLPTPDISMSAPKEESHLTAASQFNPISDHAAINAEIARGRIALTLIHPANDRCSAAYKPVNVALAKAWKCMSKPTSAAEAESFLASGSFVELTSLFVQIGVRLHRQVGALRKVAS